MNFLYKGNQIIIKNVENFEPCKTFDCGQCFRFEKCEEGDSWFGIAFSHPIGIEKRAETLTISMLDGSEADEKLLDFLCLRESDDYEAINADILENLAKNGDLSVMKEAMEVGRGIRIMRQECFETLISFIISQNNNIPRIKKIIARLCEKCGEKVLFSDGKCAGYAFPSPESIVKLGVEGLRECGTGFRDRYIFDAASKVASGEIDLEKLKNGNYTIEEKLEALMKIKGVGIKVASCVALFSLNGYDAFPIDVWVKKVMAKYFPENFDYHSFGNYSGIAQQYLFYYERQAAPAGTKQVQ